MSSEPERPTPPLDSNALLNSQGPQELSTALASAQEEITDLKDRIREERFGWIVLLVIVIDCALFLNARNWSGPVIIDLIEIGALSVIAARLGVEEFAALFGGMFRRATDLISRGG